MRGQNTAKEKGTFHRCDVPSIGENLMTRIEKLQKGTSFGNEFFLLQSGFN